MIKVILLMNFDKCSKDFMDFKQFLIKLIHFWVKSDYNWPIFNSKANQICWKKCWNLLKIVKVHPFFNLIQPFLIEPTQFWLFLIEFELFLIYFKRFDYNKICFNQFCCDNVISSDKFGSKFSLKSDSNFIEPEYKFEVNSIA